MNKNITYAETEEKVAKSFDSYTPKMTFPILHISLYKDEFELLKPLIGSTDFKYPNIKLAKGVNNIENVRLVNETTGRDIIEFNEYAAVPTPFIDYDAHKTFRKVYAAAKDYINKMDSYFG